MSSVVNRLLTLTGALIDLIKKVFGSEGIVWEKGLYKFLRKENPWEKPATFKIVNIGTYKDKESMQKALEKSRVRVGKGARDILNKIKLSEFRQSLGLVFLTAVDLGFFESASIEDICRVAKDLGLEPCPAEVGPQLCLQHPDFDGYLFIAMDPIKDLDGDLSFFMLE